MQWKDTEEGLGGEEGERIWEGGEEGLMGLFHYLP